MRFFLLSFFAAVVWSSCQTGATNSSRQPLPAEKLYVLKCAKCHELYDPKNYSDTDWNFWMTKMRKKSKLKPEEFDLILSHTEMLRGAQTTPVQ